MRLALSLVVMLAACPPARTSSSWDRDHDGITGVADKCPDVPEDSDGDADDYGCPEAATDRDHDGIVGSDGCADAPEDFDGFDDTDGCPDPDNDQDGVLDVDDRCADAAEDRDGVDDGDGCPDPT